MGHLERVTFTAHLISTPDQPGRKRMYHYIKEAKSLLSQYIYIYEIYYVRTMRALKTSILEPVLLATQFVLLSSNYIPRGYAMVWTIRFIQPSQSYTVC